MPKSAFMMIFMMKSHPAMYPESSRVAITTMVVESISSLYFLAPFSFGSQGQEAFLSSTITSMKKLRVLVSKGWGGFLAYERHERLRKRSRSQRPVSQMVTFRVCRGRFEKKRGVKKE